MNINNFCSFFEDLEANGLSKLAKSFEQDIKSQLAQPNGNLSAWLSSLNNLPDIAISHFNPNSSAIEIGQKADVLVEELTLIETHLKELTPWRKGPYNLFGMEIDTEWHSDWKWDRLLPHISPLKRKKILDVGSGNGYHLWRMLGEGANFVVGVDPYLLFVIQFLALKKFIGQQPVHLLPLGVEHLPVNSQAFDTVFSMGVLYHRRSPFDFLKQLKSQLTKGGELVLETLVIEGNENEALVPDDRYARMRNVWFIPSCLAMEKWLKRVGFKNIRTVDLNWTSIDEQRATEWMTRESLQQCLSPDNPRLTVEGYPAPLRAIFVANT